MIGHYMVYETFHFCCHVPENSLLRRMPLVNTIRRHHAAHHNMGIMMHVNMNLTFPIADWAMKTSDLKRGLLGHLFNGYDERARQGRAEAGDGALSHRRDAGRSAARSMARSSSDDELSALGRAVATPEGVAPAAPDFALRGDHIALDALLKAIGVAASGGDAKVLIAGGGVRVNGAPETRRGRKIRAGDEVALGATVVRVAAQRPG